MNERDLPKRYCLVRFEATFFKDGLVLAKERFDATSMRGARLVTHRRMKGMAATSAIVRNRENGENARIEGTPQKREKGA